jgi:glucokinase
MTYRLLCDIGGTHVRFALQHTKQKGFSTPEKYKTTSFETFEDAALFFLKTNNIDPSKLRDIKIASAVRPRNGVVTFDTSYKATSWQIDPARISATLNIPKRNIHLLMDTEAQFLGLKTLKPSDCISLKQGNNTNKEGLLLISIGTGLGHAYQPHTTPHPIPIPIVTHGGHMPPLANSSEQEQALHYIRSTKDSQLIYEDVVSGRGFYNLYAYSCNALSKPLKAHDIYGLEPLFNDLKDSYEIKMASRLFSEFLGLYIHQCAAYTHCFGMCYLIGGLLRKLDNLGLLDKDALNTQLSLNMVNSVAAKFGALSVSLVKREHLTLHGLITEQTT